MTKCTHRVEIETCRMGLERDRTIVCRFKNYEYLYSKHPDMFPAGKPDRKFGECDRADLYSIRHKRLNSWRKKARAYMESMNA